MRNFEFPGRSTVYACHGMAATSHPLATTTALKILQAGGTAMDAAIAACAVQCVVEPQSTGIGGDCFALYAPQGSADIIAFNGSGRTPAAAHNEWFQEHKITAIERHSAHAVTVPGAVDSWCRLNQDYGTMPLAELLAPAIAYARDGYPIHPRVAVDWQAALPALQRHANSRRLLLNNNAAPVVGSVHKQPALAATLEIIAQQGREGFYHGTVAEDIVSFLNTEGGLHTLEDFAQAQGEYVTPIKTAYRDHDVYECPPNGQGIAALQILNILSGYDFSTVKPLATERLHLQIAAKQLAYRDRDSLIGDQAFGQAPLEHLLSQAHADQLRTHIPADRAMAGIPAAEFPNHEDTVYLCVVDKDRNAVSFINSLFHSFGSALVAPLSGVCLHSRGSSFVTQPGHANGIDSNKRPLHTIIPGMLVKNDRAIMPFGVMGGHYQAVGHAHLLSNILDFGLDVQEAIDLPRVFASQEGVVEVESSVPESAVIGLQRYGYRPTPTERPIGGAQAIMIDWENGVLSGGSEPRKDGCALGY